MKRLFLRMAICLMLLGSGRADAMSLNVQDGDIGELLRSIARLGNLDIIVDRTVTGSVSLKVDEAEPEEMLRQIARIFSIRISLSLQRHLLCLLQ